MQTSKSAITRHPSRMDLSLEHGHIWTMWWHHERVEKKRTIKYVLNVPLLLTDSQDWSPGFKDVARCWIVVVANCGTTNAQRNVEGVNKSVMGCALNCTGVLPGVLRLCARWKKELFCIDPTRVLDWSDSEMWPFMLVMLMCSFSLQFCWLSLYLAVIRIWTGHWKIDM
jgi:hypothetical protein